MAKRMVEREAPFDLFSVINAFVRRLSKDPTMVGKTEAEIRTEAIKRAGERLKTKPVEKVHSERVKKQEEEAREWSQKAKGDEASHRQAEMEAKISPYDPTRLTEATGDLTLLNETLKQLGRTAPDFLHAETIEHSPEAAAFALKIAQLPKNLQENPDVLYREAARLYWTMEWTASSTPVGAVNEARGLLDRTFGEIERLRGLPAHADFGDATPEALWQGLDRRVDLYRTKRLESFPASKLAGVPPKDKDGKVDKRAAGYKSWLEKRSKEVQHQQLDRTLLNFQRQIDSPVVANLETQRELMDNLLKNLRGGLEIDIPVEDVDFDVKYPVQKYNLEAQEYIDLVQKQRDITQEAIAMERDRQLQKSRREHITISWKQLKEIGLDNPERVDNDELNLQFLSQEDVNLIFGKTDAQGDSGVWQWYRKFAQLIYSQGKEPGKQELPDLYEWKDFEKLMLWAYGEKGQSQLTYLSDMWKTEGRRNGLVHNISYSGGDAKKKLEGLAYMTPDDLQHEKVTYTWSNVAETHMEQSVFDLAATRGAEYQEKLRYLRGEMPDAAVRRREYLEWLEKKQKEYKIKKKSGHLSEEEAKVFGEVSLKKEAQEQGMRRDKYLEWLETRTKLGESLTQDEGIAFRNILDAKNRVNGGVNIQDQDMLFRDGPYGQLVKLQIQYDELTRSNNLTLEQVQLKQELARNIKAKWKDFTLNPNEVFGAENGAELSAYGGFSPIEIETFRRVVADLKMQGIENPPMWKVKDAILSARRSFIGSGRAVTIAANVAVMPALEYAPRGRDVMPSGFAEQLERLENVELFMYRFSMGGKYGEASRALLDVIMLDQQGLKTHAAEILKTMKKGESREARMARAAFAMASDATGIQFTELLRNKLLGSGFIFDGTTWRMDIAIMDQVRARILEIKQADKLPVDAVLDNLALGVQLALAETKEHRRAILDRMLMRTPSKFFQLLGGETFDKMLSDKGLKINSAEGQTLQRALSLVERRLWEDEKWRYKKDVNLADPTQYKDLFGKAFEVLGVDEVKGEKYRGVIEAMQNFVKTTTDRPTKTSILDEWAGKKFPITLTLSDFDWKDTRFDFLSAYTHERRMINDQFPKLEAMVGFIEFMTSPDMLSPLDPEKTSLPKILEIKKKVNNWATTSDAEEVAKTLSRVFYAFNHNRAATKTIWGWIPGAVTAMKNIGEWDLRKDSLFGKIASRLGVPDELLDHKIAHWPHSVSQAVSYSVRFTGAEGNAYDEFMIEHLLRFQQRIGTFTEHPEFVHDLRNEFKTGLPYRFLGTARKYWWTVPAATIALASVESAEEEKKRSKS